MKKLLGIVVVSLLWCNLSFAEDSELNIKIKKATQETDVLKINEGYELNCEAELEDFAMAINQKIVKSNNLISEATIDFGQEGQLYFKIQQKIKSNGKLSKEKFKIHYSPDFDKDLKKTIKQYMGMYKEAVAKGFSSSSIYGKTLIPMQIEDKKKAKQFLSFMKKASKFMDAEAKDFVKELKVKIYDHYLGTTNIESEKFYILKSYMVMEHPDKDFLDFVNEMSEEMQATSYTIVHVPSGYSVQIAEETYPICTIYKQDKELVKFDTSDIF